jgi:hypothetical protein
LAPPFLKLLKKKCYPCVDMKKKKKWKDMKVKKLW